MKATKAGDVDRSRCPQLPDFSSMSAEELARISSQPLRCLNCGETLELTCQAPAIAGRVVTAPVTVKFASAQLTLEFIEDIEDEDADIGGDEPQDLVDLVEHGERVDDQADADDVDVPLEATPSERIERTRAASSEPAPPSSLASAARVAKYNWKPRRCNPAKGGCGEMYQPTGPRGEMCHSCRGR